MEKSVKITGIIAVTAVVLLLIGSSLFTGNQNTVSAEGFSELKVVPDLVTVNFNVETKGNTASNAKDANSEIVDKLIVEVLKLGFERKDIQTSNFNVYPDYTWGSNGRKLNGYRATHSIVVELSTDKSERIGELIDAGVDAGASVSYINFELSTELQNKYKSDALKLASEDAKSKAESVAFGLNKRLGKLVSVSTSDFNYSPWGLYNSVESASVEDAKVAATNIQPGEQSVSARVSVVYKIN